jgi:hypothetical protein
MYKFKVQVEIKYMDREEFGPVPVQGQARITWTGHNWGFPKVNLSPRLKG